MSDIIIYLNANVFPGRLDILDITVKYGNNIDELTYLTEWPEELPTTPKDLLYHLYNTIPGFNVDDIKLHWTHSHIIVTMKQHIQLHGNKWIVL